MVNSSPLTQDELLLLNLFVETIPRAYLARIEEEVDLNREKFRFCNDDTKRLIIAWFAIQIPDFRFKTKKELFVRCEARPELRDAVIIALNDRVHIIDNLKSHGYWQDPTDGS